MGSQLSALDSQPRRDFFAARADRVELLRAECERWIGTPFRQNSRVCGPAGGVDCANFVAAVFEFVDPLIGAITVPRYEVNHAEHSSESQLRAWFDRPEVRVRVRLLDDDEPHVDGDLVFPEVGHCEHHLGIRIGQLVYHIGRRLGVVHMTVGQLRFHRSRYRLLDAETVRLVNMVSNEKGELVPAPWSASAAIARGEVSVESCVTRYATFTGGQSTPFLPALSSHLSTLI